MKLATILTSMILVLALGIVGCDSGSGDGGGGNGGAPSKVNCEGTAKSLGSKCAALWEDIAACCPGDKEAGEAKADEVVCGMQAEEMACGAGAIAVGPACAFLEMMPECAEGGTPEEDTIDAPECDATCVGKCGMVGDCDCGGCDAGFMCVEATNLCAAEVDCNTVCAAKECGTFEGCNCGECGDGFTCNMTTGVCEEGDVCVPDCAGKQCGPDGCQGSCGLCPCVGCDPAATMCNDMSGMCEAAAELTCTGINDCMATCNPEDQACLQDCMNQGSAEAQQQLNAVIQCLIDNGAQQCPPGDAQCQNDIIMEHCMDEYTACFPGGELDCSEMFDCMQTCPANDQACLQDCYNQGTIDAQNQYQAIASCVIEQCGEEMDPECVNAAQQGACAAVFADCFNLGKPGFASGPNGGSSSDYVNIKSWMMFLDKDKLYN